MRRFASNLSLRLLSVLLALVLWFAIAGEKTSERGFSAPVEMINMPRDMELVAGAVDTVDVRVRASPGLIGQLGPANVSAQIDLSGAAAGERIVHLTPATIRVPFGVRVVKVQPSLLTLKLERTLERDVTIRPRVVGSPAPGYEIGSVASEPSTVRLGGPRTRVERLDAAYTEELNVEGAQATQVFDDVSVGFEDPSLHVAGNPRARVTVEVREARGERVFDDVRVEVRGTSAVVTPSRVRIVLAGPKSVLSRLSGDAVKAYVEVARIRGASRAPVAVELAPGSTGVAVERTEPREVAVRPRAS
jgi:YbbR domain-containing protein